MSKETSVPSTKKVGATPAKAQPVVENKVPVAAEAAPATPKTASTPKTPVATKAAVAKAPPKAKVVKKTEATLPLKKASAEKAAPAPKTPGKPEKKPAPVAKAKAIEAPKVEKIAKVKKPKLVRDSFTIPESDYALFATLKQRALLAGIEVKKSELLRAAVVLMSKLNDADFATAISQVERIKIGRPKK